MKQLVIPIAIVVALIAFFVIIDRKDFGRHDGQPVQRESLTSNIQREQLASVPETKPATKSKPAAKTNSVAETESVTEAKHVETKLVAETKTVKEAKSVTETKSAAETKPEDKPAPVARAVVTADEAEKLNAEALVEFEVYQTALTKESARLERGFRLAFSEPFKNYKMATFSKTSENILIKKGYDPDEFKKRDIPRDWSIDYYSIPSDAQIKKSDNGYNIVSPQGPIRLIGQHLNAMRSSFIFELTIKNLSDQESEIKIGVYDSGIIRNGYNTLTTEVINSKEEKTIEVELSVFDQFANIAPTISVKGDITLVDLEIYRKDHDHFSIVEGEIAERSELPEPNDTDYPDCRFTAHFIGNAILSGMPCNKELSLSIDGFLKKNVLPTNNLKAGDRIKCAIVPVDSLPEELASIQEADDLSLFTFESYLVTTYEKISSYTDFTRDFNALVPFKSDTFEFKSVFNRGFNPPIPESVKDAQKKKIEKDLEEANKMLAYLEDNRDDIEQRFQDAWTKEKERFPDGFNTIKNENGSVSLYWRNVDNSFWCLPPRYTLIPKKPHEIPQDKIDAVVAFKDFLESNGIQLIVSLVPDRYAISSRVINPDFRSVPDLQTATYVKQLSEAGVECPYEVTTILENYNKFEFAYLFPSDYHPGATTQYAVAEEMTKRLSRLDLPRKLDESLFTFVPTITYKGARQDEKYSYPSNCDIGDNTPGKMYLSEAVFYDGKEVIKDSESEILTIGKSFMETPISSQKSFPSFLSERTLHPIDQYFVAAQGPMTVVIQRIFEQPEFFLKGKKVLVLYMAAEHVSATVLWNNIADMDRKKSMLNGKKMVDTLFVAGNGEYDIDFAQDEVRSAWLKFEGKNDIKCLNDERFEIFNQTIHQIDAQKPFVAVVQTVRSSLFPVPTLFVNGIGEPIPAAHHAKEVFWQDLYFLIPAGTNQLKVELQGQANTVVGFNKVLIYQ